MTQIHHGRTSTNPYIDRVWYSQNISDGVYVATPDGSWDLVLGINKDGSRMLLLTGQATEPAYVPYLGGTSGIVISFAPGAYLPHLAQRELLNTAESLPFVGDDHFSLAGQTFVLPTFENAEELVDDMVRTGVLKNDAVIDGVLQGNPKATSVREVQRRFKNTTGITRKTLEQIRQAQHAVKLLQAGKSQVETAAEAGYTDQSHMVKALKRFMHTKPSDVSDIHKL